MYEIVLHNIYNGQWINQFTQEGGYVKGIRLHINEQPNYQNYSVFLIQHVSLVPTVSLCAVNCCTLFAWCFHETPWDKPIIPVRKAKFMYTNAKLLLWKHSTCIGSKMTNVLYEFQITTRTFYSIKFLWHWSSMPLATHAQVIVNENFWKKEHLFTVNDYQQFTSVTSKTMHSLKKAHSLSELQKNVKQNMFFHMHFWILFSDKGFHPFAMLQHRERLLEYCN